MRFQQVKPSRQTDANREFDNPARTELRLSLLVLAVLTIIAFLSYPKWA
jgi:hypothetical protein